MSEDSKKAIPKKKRNFDLIISRLIQGAILVTLCLLLFVSILSGFGFTIFSFDGEESGFFSIILTCIGFFITSSILLPRFLLRQEVENVTDSALRELKADIISDFDRIVKEEVEKINTKLDNELTEVKKDLDSKLDEMKSMFKDYSKVTELKRTDAHLSRMIAFNLQDKEPIWAIGWCCRTLKRYIALEPKNTKDYQDFIEMVNQILIDCKTTLYDTIYNLYEDTFKSLHSNETGVNNVICGEILDNIDTAIQGQGNDSREQYRKAMRAIKDIIDLNYGIIRIKDTLIKKGGRPLFNKYDKCIKQVGVLIKLLIITLSRQEEYSFYSFKDEFYLITDYKEDEVYQYFFEELLETLIMRDDNQTEANDFNLVLRTFVNEDSRIIQKKYRNDYNKTIYTLFNTERVAEKLKNNSGKYNN